MGEGVPLGGQGGCEQRIEVFVKIQKKIGGRGCEGRGEARGGGRVGRGGVRLGGQGGCEQRIEVFVIIRKKFGGRGGGVGGSG